MCQDKYCTIVGEKCQHYFSSIVFIGISLEPFMFSDELEKMIAEAATSEKFDYSANPNKNWKRVVFAPGRFQPPHAGHEDMIRELVMFARKKKAEPVIVVVKGSAISEKNPLTGESRKKFLQAIFKGIKIVLADNPFKVVEEDFYPQGMMPVGIVAGSDRVAGYQRLGEYYHIPGFEVKSLKRDPDAEGSAAYSATQVRDKVKEKDEEGFLDMMPRSMSQQTAERMYAELSKIIK